LKANRAPNLQGSLTLILGGVRSGKSRFAQELAAQLGGDDVLFVATAEARDDEMRHRIEHHQRSRPANWQTLERPLGVATAISDLKAVQGVVLMDCLTLLVSNILCNLESPLPMIDELQQRVESEVDALIAVARDWETHLIVVSGEVGLGVVPEHAMGRMFRDLLGWANQRLAQHATTTYWMVAGLPIDATSLATTVERAAIGTKKWVRPLFCAMVALLPLAFGCNWDSTAPKVTANGTSAPEASMETGARAPFVIVDRLDRKVSLNHLPQKIVSLSPSTTELLFALGAGKYVVGATTNCNYPEEALKVPRVGSGTLDGISREAILGMQPDLVLCKWDTHQPLIELFDRVGIAVIAVGPESLEELFAEAKLIGQATGHEAEAESLIQKMTERRDRLAQRVANIAEPDQRSVFYEVWDDPLMTAGPRSFIGELMRLGRMKNLFADTDIRYPKISSEVVVDRNPDVILAPTNHMKKVDVEQMADRPGWRNIKAITQKQVFIINGDEVSRCGPRLLDALEEMIDAVYPVTKTPEVSQP